MRDKFSFRRIIKNNVLRKMFTKDQNLEEGNRLILIKVNLVFSLAWKNASNAVVLKTVKTKTFFLSGPITSLLK